jgi:hypothetical protein
MTKPTTRSAPDPRFCGTRSPGLSGPGPVGFTGADEALGPERPRDILSGMQTMVERELTSERGSASKRPPNDCSWSPQLPAVGAWGVV